MEVREVKDKGNGKMINNKKPYIINLQFGTWQNQLWFMGDEGRDEEFSRAEKGLDEIGDSCTNSSDFFDKAVKHFEGLGFARIYK